MGVPVSEKACTKCGVIQKLEQFSQDFRIGRKEAASCKACESKRKKIWYQKNKEKVKLKNYMYQKTNLQD